MRPALLLPLLAAAVPSVAAPAKVVAYLAQATTAAQIYTAPSPKAKGLYRVQKGANLAVRPAGKSWYAVLMADRRLAYIPGQAIEIMRMPETGEPVGYTQAEVAAFGKAQRPASTTVASRGGTVRGTSDARIQMALEAMRLEGSTPYKWGGNELGSGIDCSGFVKKMYGMIGVGLPRTASEQATVGVPITRLEDLQTGDRLYFYEAKRNKIGHTGIYLGGGYFVHSSSGHKGIARDYLSERWRKILVAARR